MPTITLEPGSYVANATNQQEGARKILFGMEMGTLSVKTAMIEIIWHNCAEQMPPDDETIIICIYGGMIDKMRADVFHCACKFSQKVSIIWTEFTREKWEELNR